MAPRRQSFFEKHVELSISASCCQYTHTRTRTHTPPIQPCSSVFSVYSYIYNDFISSCDRSSETGSNMIFSADEIL